MPVAQKARAQRAAVQARPSHGTLGKGGCAPEAPHDADLGLSPVAVRPTAPNHPSAGHQQPPLPNCGAACSGTLQVVLSNHSLWLTFHRQKNEMLLIKPGRAMFPFLAYHIRGMEPRARYRVSVGMVRVDQHHWRYENAGWAPDRPEESKVPGNQVCPHPDSPNTGAHWMKREIVFKMLRLSNAEPAGPSARRALWLQSQHRYRPRLHVEELACGAPGAPAAPSRSHVFTFPETEFIAVTAYRNPELVRLKIEHNPYARAFRKDAPSAGGLSAGQPQGLDVADPSSETASDLADERPLPQERQERDWGSSPPGHGLQAPQPLSAQAGALPPSPLPATPAAATPYQDRPVSLPQTSPGNTLHRLQSGLPKPPEPAHGAREQPRLPQEIWTPGTQTDSEAAARGERAPKKRHRAPGTSGSPPLCSARTHLEAQAQRLPATEASAKASPEAASGRPGVLLGTEEAAVQEGNSAIPVACWAMQQPQQLQYYVFDSTPSSSSSSSSSSSNGPAMWQVMTLNPGLHTSTAPLDMSYGWGPESLLALLQGPIFPSGPLQATGGNYGPSLPLHPLPGAQGEQIWPHLSQTQVQDSPQTEGALKKRAPPASGSQARCSGRDNGEAQDQLLTAAASSPYTFSGAPFEAPGQLLTVQEPPVQDNRSGIPVFCNAPQQSKPPLDSLLHSSPSSSNSSNGLPTLQVMTLNTGLQTSTAPLDMSYGWGPESLLALLQAPTFPGEPSQATGGDCRPSLPLHPFPKTQGEQIWPHLAQTQLQDSPQTEGAPKKRTLSPPASDSQARCPGSVDGEAQDQLLTAAASSPYTFSGAPFEAPGQLLNVQGAPAKDNKSGIPVPWNAPQQSQPPLDSLLYSNPSSSNSRSLSSLEDVAIGHSTSPLAMPHEPSPEEALFSLLEASSCLSEHSQGSSSDCLPSGPSKPMHPLPGAQETQSPQQEICTSLTETISDDSNQAPQTWEKTPFSPKNYSTQDASFLIPDFSWDSLFPE